jgi:hypothetical protein
MEDKFIDIVNYTKNTNDHYNSSGFSFYLYGLIKMIKPITVIELGTGVGTMCFLAAQGCKENNIGKVITVDNGVDETQSNFNLEVDFNNLKTKFELDNFLELRNIKLDLNNLNELCDIDEVSILFNDISCAPHYFLTILKWLLPRVKNECYFIIDRGATFWPNYCVVELVIPQLNQGKIPKILFNLIDNDDEFEKLIKKYKFSIQHVIKSVDENDNQDSFTIVKIEDNDVGYRMI